MSLGVAEAEGGFNTAIEKCGTMDKTGKTVGIVNVTGINMMWVGLGLKLLGFVVLLILLQYQSPLGFLPGDRLGIEWMQKLQHWEVFNTGTWLVVVLLYAIWVAVSILRSNLHRGIPGVDQIFSRYGKVVRTVKPGEGWVNIDPRVRPTAVVSRKPMMMELGPVVSPAKENVKIEAHGTIVFRVLDSFKLFEQGGFNTFFEQLSSLYSSLQRDLILQFSARRFNQYMIEPASYAHDRTDSIDARLGRLERSALTTTLVNELSEIGELDVAKMDLRESDQPERQKILPALNELAGRYGIEVIDYIPQGNLVEADFFGQLAVDLVRSIQRLHQATVTLSDTLRQEIEQEITASISHTQRSGLEIDKLCGELRSVKGTLQGETERQSIIDATVRQMESAVGAILAEYLGKVEGLQSRVTASQIDAASVERFVDEYESLIQSFETEFLDALPKVRVMVVERLEGNDVSCKTDLVAEVMEKSGLTSILGKLKNDDGKDGKVDELPTRIKEEAAALAAGTLIERIQQQLGAINPSTGLNMDQYAPERIAKQIEEITAGIATNTTATEA